MMDAGTEPPAPSSVGNLEAFNDPSFVRSMLLVRHGIGVKLFPISHITRFGFLVSPRQAYGVTQLATQHKLVKATIAYPSVLHIPRTNEREL